MLLMADIGNTNITLGIYDKEDFLGTFRMTTKLKRSSDDYGMVLLNFLNSKKVKVSDIDHVIISSVVPIIMHSFSNSIRKYIMKEPIIIGPGTKTGISIKSDEPRNVGADRIVDIAGAYYTYGGPLLVIDYGTATTFDYVDENGVFTYGVICPGIEICSQALWTQAAKLPEVEIKPSETILAKNTISSMQSGIYFGFIGQSEYIISKFKEELNKDMKVIATGGLGRIIANGSDKIDVYDPNLTFKGLKIIYEKYLSKKEKR